RQIMKTGRQRRGGLIDRQGMSFAKGCRLHWKSAERQFEPVWCLLFEVKLAPHFSQNFRWSANEAG
ncbi:hypothetical protein ACCS91_39585, partial [Rhizobium ruizarguesonis]